MTNYEVTVYITLVPVLNSSNVPYAVRVAATHLTRPKDPSGVVLAVRLKVPESMVFPSVVVDLSDETTILDLKEIHGSL